MANRRSCATIGLARCRACERRLLRLLLDAGYLPVIAPIAASAQGEAVNVDGDRAAAALAEGLGAKARCCCSRMCRGATRFPTKAA
ncbi:MAG: hypothetical protein U0Z44_02875 [Kouleothrix sp.]